MKSREPEVQKIGSICTVVAHITLQQKQQNTCVLFDRLAFYCVVYLIFLRTQLSVSKDFSLSLDVPPYLIRGEEIVLEVNLINHLEHEIEVLSTEWKGHTLFKVPGYYLIRHARSPLWFGRKLPS